MVLPDNIALAIEKLTEGVSRGQLKLDAESISLKYRNASGSGKSLVSTPGEVLAYSAVRMPATYGAVLSALKHTLCLTENKPAPTSLIDAGAGTGAASFAAASLIKLDSITCFERESSMCDLGQRLMSGSEKPLSNAKWIRGDIRKDSLKGRADLVISSYMLNEMTDEERNSSLEKLWAATGMFLLIVEPGTPAGYSLIMKARRLLLDKGAYITAPCPHENACPIAENDPYGCHFSCRVPRSRLHREIKGGEAPYEDEKYIYLALSRTPSSRAESRVIRHPYIEKGKITLNLCSAEGLEKVTIRKSDDRYKQAGKLKWGDAVKF